MDSGQDNKREISWFHKMRPRRYQYLLAVLLVCVLLNPIVGQDLGGRIFSAIFFCLALVNTCVATIPRRRVLFVGVLLSFMVAIYGSLVLTVNAPPFNSFLYQTTAKVFAIVLYFLSALVIFRDVIAEGDVDLNKLCGSVCFYLLIGILFGQLYQLLDVVDPGCFYFEMSKLEKHGELSAFERSNLLNYFSYVTLTTLGYGDIQPVARLTRTLAFSEALFSQIYLAILVARLVGLHIAKPSSGPGRQDYSED